MKRLFITAASVFLLVGAASSAAFAGRQGSAESGGQHQ